jgi:hypothetical protein
MESGSLSRFFNSLLDLWADAHAWPMTSFASGFRQELLKVAFGPGVHRAFLNAQVDVARKLLGVDPRVPTPFSESQLDDAVSKMRMEQRMVEMNRMAMGLDAEPGGDKTAMPSYMTPRTARRVIQNSGYDDRDAGFRAIAQQLTGQGDINRMTQYQLKALMAIMTGRASG